MGRNTKSPAAQQALYVGIDLHSQHWQVTIRTSEIELFNGRIPARWEDLRRLLDRYPGYRLQVVYEAGYFGFWLHDRLVAYGADCMVTPPSLIPQEYGNRVKTDRRDSRKLAFFLAKGLLKRVWVPSPQERSHRQVLRRRRQLIGDRVRVQNRIKAELRFYGVPFPAIKGKWSHRFVDHLRCVQLGDRWLQESFERLLAEYDFLSQQIDRQTQLLKELAQTELYCERVQILRSIPGIGLIAAMEILLELQAVARFRRGQQLAAYVGLTPAQYSSGEQVRMGRITGIGKRALRGVLIEAAWRLIGKDRLMRARYERLKRRAGAKRAIVAIARQLLLCSRRLLLDGQPYRTRLAA
jgi:transposase